MPSAGRTEARRWRLAAVPLSIAAHLALLMALVMARSEPPVAIDAEPMSVQLVYLPPPAPEPAPVPEDRPDAPAPKPVASPPAAKAVAKAITPERPAPRRVMARRAPPTPDVAPMATSANALADGAGALSDGEIAGAAVAGGGTGGGGAGAGVGGGSCDMLRRLQDALRRDRRVQAAVAQAHRGRPLLVWNGDWVRHGDQEGDGLAAVREAIAWEVGFAPPPCRAQAVRGLVLISLSDKPGASRLALGSAAWRWSDLVRSRSRQLQR